MLSVGNDVRITAQLIRGDSEELKLVAALQTKLKAKSKVEVVRRGLQLLQEVTDRESLREAYRRASSATRASLSKEIRELDHLAA